MGWYKHWEPSQASFIDIHSLVSAEARATSEAAEESSEVAERAYIRVKDIREWERGYRRVKEVRD